MNFRDRRTLPALLQALDDPVEPGRGPLVLWVLWVLLAVHAAMGVYDWLHPGVFLNSDRAISRLAFGDGLLAAWRDGGVGPYLAAHGVVGDYALHALLGAAFGRAGLIGVQVALTLLAGLAVYRLGRLLGWHERPAALAALVWLLLPHSLLFPHQLSAEALYSPLLVICLWLSGELVARPRAGLLIGGALLLGVATLIRPITLLWPLLVAGLLARAGRGRDGVAYALTALAPLLLWASFIGWQTGSFGLGKAEHDLGHNLYQRVARIAESLPPGEAAAVRGEFLRDGDKGSLPAAEYARFAVAYPGPFVEHALRDTMVFVGKSGVERLPIDYFEWDAAARARLQDSDRGWRATLEQAGAWETLGWLWRTQGLVLSLSLIGAASWLALMALAGIGGWQVLRGEAPTTAAGCFVAAQLVALPLYLLVFSQVVDALQSRHRAPAEAALVLLAMAGLLRLARVRVTCARPAGLEA